MIVTESAMESVFSKALGHSYKHKNFTKNDSDEVCAGICFW